jgi:hypothetical protein
MKTGMVEQMRELYDEGLATHVGPESCAGCRKAKVKR